MLMKPWPTCPICGARRVAVCRFCKTRGTSFRTANLDYVLPPESEEDSELEDRSCSCGRCTCGNGAGYGGSGNSEDSEVVVRPSLNETLGPAYSDEIRMQHTDAKGHIHSGKQTSSLKLSEPLDRDPDPPADGEEYPLAVICSCCKEMIYPQFLDTCPQCGLHYPDGIPTQENEFHEENTRAITWTAIAMLAICVAVALAFWFATH